jgi:hypothetical protein
MIPRRFSPPWTIEECGSATNTSLFSTLNHAIKGDPAVMSGTITPLSSTTRRKIFSALVATGIFACLGSVSTIAFGRPLEQGFPNAVLVGMVVGLLEEFYFQSHRGNWLRSKHPLLSIPVYVAIILVFYLVLAHITRLFLGRLDDCQRCIRGCRIYYRSSRCIP